MTKVLKAHYQCHSAVVFLNDDGEAEITEINEGDTVEDMLNYVHLDAKLFQQTYAELIEARLPKNEGDEVFKELVDGLKGYTYLEDL